jgi:hypothetical protein
MSSYAAARCYVLELIEPLAHVRCLAYESLREPLQEQLEGVYRVARLALIEKRLAGEE